MWLQFFSQNAHFGICLFSALVCFGICWLYFDAWSLKRAYKELFKWLGFGTLGLAFAFEATIIEQTVLGESIFGHWTTGISITLKLAAYIMIIAGQLLDPLQVIPKNEGLKLQTSNNKNPSKTDSQSKDSESKASKANGVIAFVSISSKLLAPFGALAIAGLYWRRATVGLERHLRKIAQAFVFFAAADLLNLVKLASNTTNPILYNHVATFGWIWWLQLLMQLGGTVVLGIWTWGYLIQRFFSQMFMIFTAMIGFVFIIVSIAYTGLLLGNIRNNSLSNLSTAANVLNYALSSKKAEATSAAEQLAGSTDIVDAVVQGNRSALKSLTNGYLQAKKLTGTAITNQTGQVLIRVQDTEQWGDSLSGDSLVKRSLLGLNQSTINTVSSVGAPKMQVRSGVAIKDRSGNIVGSVVTSVDFNSAFVDGIKESTGLESSIYSGNVLSASTFLSSDNKSRSVGVTLKDKTINKTVLQEGKSYLGSSNLQHKQMLAVLVPIKDVDNAPVGMLLVAQPQSKILEAAGHSVELTFLFTMALLIVSIYPIMFISKIFVRQIG